MAQPQIFRSLMEWPEFRRFGGTVDLWPDFQRLRREMNRFIAALPYGADFPAINIWLGQEDAIVTSELPGIDPGKLDISVVNDVLKLSGSREAPAAKEGETYYRQERSSGAFSRTFQLPFTVDASKVEAKYEKGILQIILPRAEAAKPKKIAVKID